MNNSEFQEKTGQIDRLVQRVNAFSDDQARTTSLELLQSMMDLHGAAMSRIVELLSESESGHPALAKLGSDPLICGLLVLYGIHPVSLEERVARAIKKVRPQFQKNGGSVELVGVNEEAVTVRVQTSSHNCGSSPEALRIKVEQAILEAAPEMMSVIIEGFPQASFVHVSSIQPVTKGEMSYEKSTA